MRVLIVSFVLLFLGTADAAERRMCQWVGKAPACRKKPKCPPETPEHVKSEKGNCLTGQKHLCCTKEEREHGPERTFSDTLNRISFSKDGKSCVRKCIKKKQEFYCNAGETVVEPAGHKCGANKKAYLCCRDSEVEVIKGPCRETKCRSGVDFKCNGDEIEVSRTSAGCVSEKLRKITCCHYSIDDNKSEEDLIMGTPGFPGKTRRP